MWHILLAEQSYQIFLKAFGTEHSYTKKADNLRKQSQAFYQMHLHHRSSTNFSP